MKISQQHQGSNPEKYKHCEFSFILWIGNYCCAALKPGKFQDGNFCPSLKSEIFSWGFLYSYFLDNKSTDKVRKSKSSKHGKWNCQGKTYSTLQWLLLTFSLTKGQGHCTTLDYLNLYYDLTARCALRPSLGRFSLKSKITKSQTTTEDHEMPAICIHSTPGDKGHWLSPLIVLYFQNLQTVRKKITFSFIFF